MKKIAVVIAFNCLLIFTVNTVTAQSVDQYEQAYDQFENGNYQQALNAFAAMLQQAPDNEALIYDIGLCHHYLKQYEQADYYFTQLLASEEYEYWATYQLSINDWQQGDYGAAEIGLTTVVFESNDADLVELATLRYEELLRDMPTTTLAKFNPWAGSVGAGRGQDTNIVDAQFLDATDQKDGFTDLSADISYKWMYADGKTNWQVQGLLFANRYDDIDSADLTVFSLTVNKNFYLNHWQFEIGLALEQSDAGGEDYLSQRELALQTKSDADNILKGWRLTYNYTDIDALSSEFDQLAGNTQDLSVSYRFPLNNYWYWQFGAEWINDDRDTIATTFLQSDLSAHRNGLETAIGCVYDNFSIEIGYDQRDSDYGEILRVGSLFSIKRKDERDRWYLRGDYVIGQTWSVYLEYFNIDNSSNIPRFTYQQETFLAGLTAYF